MTLQIREADFDDALDRAGIVDVLNSYASDPVGGGKALSEDVCERLVPALREHGNALVLLAFAGDRPVGMAICFMGISTFQARPLLNIHDLAVVPDYRGKGIGRALLAAAEKQAVSRGCCKLTLEVREDNLPARNLYERYGFIDFVVGKPVPTRFLSKPL
ncbi:MAG: GNAT family N-acetyltransferase [Woeseiaceae bacterium]